MSEDFNLPFGTTIIMSGKSSEEVIRMVINMWGAEQPEEVRAYQKQIIEKRQSMEHSNGMSQGGTMRSVLEMPKRLHDCFVKVTGNPEYLQDRSFLNALSREAPGLFTSKPARGGAGV